MSQKKRKAKFLAKLEGGPHDGLALRMAEPLAILEIPDEPPATYGLRPRDPERDPVHVLRYEYLSGHRHAVAESSAPDPSELSP